MEKKVTVELCMGSSCFARGNNFVLSDLENYIDENGLNDDVELVGHLCLGKCNNGPHERINGVEYSAMSSDCVIDLLKKEIGE